MAGALAAHAPHDIVENLELSPAFTSDGMMIATAVLSEHQLIVISEDAGKRWRPIASPAALHSIQRFAFSPDFASDSLIYAATLKAGVWVSNDRGKTWSRSNDGLTTLTVRDVAVSPDFATSQTLICATNQGVFRSTDSGQNWALSNTGLVNLNIRALHAVADSSSTLFAAQDTLHRSDDGGATWVPIQTFAQSLEAMASSPTFSTDGVMLVSFGRFGGGVFVSDDGATSFAPMMNGLSDLFVNDVTIADDGTLFCVSQLDGCFRASDSNASWTAFNEGFEILSDLTMDHYRAVVTAPDFTLDPRVWVSGFEGFFESADAGETYVQRDVYTQRLNRSLVLAADFPQSGKVYAGNYGGGVYAYEELPALPGPPGRAPTAAGSNLLGGPTPGGSPILGPTGTSPPSMHWVSRSTGIDVLFSSGLQISPAYAPENRELFYTYRGAWHSSDDGRSWTKIPSPPDVIITRVLAVAPDWPTDQTLFAGTNAASETWRSTDGGHSWEVATGLPASHSTRFILPSSDFATDGTVFVGTKRDGVFRSTDGGLTFVDITGSMPPNADLRSLVLDSGSGSNSFLMAGTLGAGLWVTFDAGGVWAQVGVGLPQPLEDLSIDHLALSPDFAADGTVFMTTHSHGVYRSVDSGMSWAPASNGLPLTSGRVLALSPGYATDQTLMLATQEWIWRSTDGGDSWSALPGFTRVDDLYNEIVYEGAWTNLQEPGNLSTGARGASVAGRYTEMSMDGTAFSWWGTLGPDKGIAEISLDGQPLAELDLYDPVKQPQTRLLSHTFEQAGFHVVRVTVTGLSNGASTGVNVQSDGFSFTWTVSP